MTKFRKKPVVVDAVQFNGFEGTDWEHLPPELSSFAKEISALECVGNTTISITIKTLEGSMTANIGDWIIRGVKGEVYPCKPDIFKMTYDPID